MDKFFELVAFLRIIISPLLASAIIALIYYIFTPDIPNIFIIIGIIFIGLVLGIVWAIKINKKGSADTFLSQFIQMMLGKIMNKVIITLYLINLLTFFITFNLHFFSKSFFLNQYFDKLIDPFNWFLYHVGITYLFTSIILIIITLRNSSYKITIKLFIISSILIYYLSTIYLFIIEIHNP